MEKFKALGLNDEILASIEKKGFKEPSPVQAEVIPVLINSTQDVIAMAQTGTGKTAAFGLPICQNLKATGVVKALVICPTRELAVQVCNEMSSFVCDRQFKILPVYGGQPFRDQKRELQKGVDVVVGTPGRLIEAIQKEKLIMSDLEYIVLDEVDEMMNMGFIEDIEFILNKTPKNCQRLMFSATLAPRIEKVAKKYLDNPQTFKIEKSKETANLISHIYYMTDKRNRLASLTRILSLEDGLYGIIFCQTKAETEILTSELNNQGISAEYMNGDVAQSSRETILKRFREKKCQLLVATDVAARGIDIDALTHVINYSVPDSAEAYTHRCGRTGRKGNKGIALTLAVPSEMGRLKRVMQVTKFQITKHDIPDGSKIASLRYEQFKVKLSDTKPSDLNKDIAVELLNEQDPAAVLAQVLEHYASNSFDPNAYKSLPKVKDSHDSRSSNNKSEARIRFDKGIADDFTGKTIVQFIEQKSGLSGRFINGLNIKRHFCTFSVPASNAGDVVDKLNRRCRNSSSRPIARLDEAPPRKSGGESGGRRKFRGRS